jgi:hypothetical protein
MPREILDTEVTDFGQAIGLLVRRASTLDKLELLGQPHLPVFFRHAGGL